MNDRMTLSVCGRYRNRIHTFVLSIVVWSALFSVMRANERQQELAQPKSDTVEPKATIDQPGNAAGGEQNEPQDAVPGANVKEQEKRPAIPLANDLVLGTNNPAKDAEYWIFAELSNKGGVITKLQLNHYENEDRSGPLVLLQEEIGNLHSYRLTTERHPEIAETLWEVVDNSPEQVVFRTHIRAGTLQIEKRFSLEKNSPFIKLEVVLRNLSDDPMNDISYTLNNGQGLPIENVHYSNYYRNAVVATAEPGSAAKLSKWSLLDLNFGNAHETKGMPVRFWGVDCQFFASVMLIDPNGKSQQRPRIDQAIGAPHPNLDLSSINVFAYLDSIAVPAGDELVHEYLLYNGPKDYTLLDAYQEYDLALLVDGGSFFFLPTKHLSRIVNRVLRFVGSITGDYGFALIITALLVRVVMLPLSYRQLRSRALIQYLQPQIRQLKEEYGNDKNGLSKAQMELFGRYGYNPMSGCLPAIAVAILFVAAWHGLNGSFTLRQAEFLWGLTWIHDLSVPDQLFPFGQPVFILGGHFNLLPALTLILMYADSFKPPRGYENLPGEKRKWWPVFFFALCYTLPAASWICILTYLAGARIEKSFLPVPSRENFGIEDLRAEDPATEELESEDEGTMDEELDER